MCGIELSKCARMCVCVSVSECDRSFVYALRPMNKWEPSNNRHVSNINFTADYALYDSFSCYTFHMGGMNFCWSFLSKATPPTEIMHDAIQPTSTKKSSVLIVSSFRRIESK